MTQGGKWSRQRAWYNGHYTAREVFYLNTASLDIIADLQIKNHNKNLLMVRDRTVFLFEINMHDKKFMITHNT